MSEAICFGTVQREWWLFWEQGVSIGRQWSN